MADLDFRHTYRIVFLDGSYIDVEEEVMQEITTWYVYSNGKVSRFPDTKGWLHTFSPSSILRLAEMGPPNELSLPLPR